MSDEAPPDLGAVKAFLRDALRLYGEGRNEEVLKQNLVSHLPRMFPEVPPWVDHHVGGAESMVGYAAGGRQRRGFIDNLVGYTTVEYEHDLTNATVFATGFGQVHQHLAGRLNAGEPQAQLIGVLSDTLRWRAYRIAEVAHDPAETSVGPDDLVLEEVAQLDIMAANDFEAEGLADFLVRYFGREASLPLAAASLASDLGFDSTFCAPHLASLRTLVDTALADRPEYAAIIERLWADFVSYLGDATGTGRFDRDIYVSELYLVTLAKLICANVVSRTGLHSDRAELADILAGEFFKARGLLNVVEYDFFGWLNAEPHVSVLLDIAESIQRDLRVYDFATAAPHDIFGRMMAQLARRSQRLLLGQEWTPEWLASAVAVKLVDMLPDGEMPRFVDVCCGSGSFLVEVVKVVRERLLAAGADEETIRRELARVATGFDIDPLAVLLAKVNWVVAARDWLAPFDGSRPVTIPVYLADSLFGKTPLGDVDTHAGTYELLLHDRHVALPRLLVSPEYRRLFDSLLEHAYALAMANAGRSPHTPVVAGDLGAALREAEQEANASMPDDVRGAIGEFFSQLVMALDDLQQLGLNGIWSFVLRNSYRPGLVTGQFNGLISNPPWLALSKIANNPYSERLRRSAEEYAIKPPGPSHLHIELATTFLLHGVDHYLQDGALVGCVLPETLLNGYQHTPFRRGLFRRAARRVPLGVTEGWRAANGTFKNEAIVLFGSKGSVMPRNSFPGEIASPDGFAPCTFRVLTLGDRVIWSDNPNAEEGNWFNDIQLRQGADVMPRSAIFFNAEPVGIPSEDRFRLSTIDRSTSGLAYLVNEGKKLTDFVLPPVVVSGRYLFDVLLSKHLVPFVIGDPARGFLPFERDAAGTWRPVAAARLAATPRVEAAVNDILSALGPGVGLGEYFHSIDSNRRKLSVQEFPAGGYLVVYGAGGTYACAAFAPLSRFDPSRLIIDQTLYWTVVETEDEALYICGLFNSDARDVMIQGFQPHGQFGRRHVHELPTKVTPGFDPSVAAHMAVVDATRELLHDIAAQRSDAQWSTIFDPARRLPSRRSKMRSELMPSLSSFAAYDEACKELYGLG